MARNKGQRAERLVIGILQPVVTKVYIAAEISTILIPQLERNLMQSNKGGYDIAGLEWLALEVKHQETLNLNSWWEQTLLQSSKLTHKGKTKIPVLFYKQNNRAWKIRMYGYLDLGSRRVKCPADITLESFMVWFEERVKMEM